MKNLSQLLCTLAFVLLLPTQVLAEDDNTFIPEEHQEQYDAASSKCQGCPHASACFEAQQTKAPLRGLLWPIPLLLAAVALSYFSKIKYKHLIWIGLSIGSIYLIQHSNINSEKTEEPKALEQSNEDLIEDDFAPFEETTSSSEDFPAFEETESTSTDDEFAPFDETSGDDEFQSFDTEKETLQTGLSEQERELLWYVIPILLLTIFAGFLSRFKSTRKLRLIFLLGGLVYMGFYNGGCPCMISSFQDVVMWLFGAKVFWGTMLWFFGLMIITYFFGRVWCGWFCHLGALQEFLFKSNIIRSLTSYKAQRVFIIMRYVVFIILVIQIALTRTNIFIHYDPFKVAFNLFSTSTTGYVLLAILLLSSLLINRPFCRGFCPVGLAMGWVMRIPGAALLKPNDACISCKVCHNTCDSGAIVKEEKHSFINNAECIRCGECQDSCPKSAMKDSFSKGDITFDCNACKK